MGNHYKHDKIDWVCAKCHDFRAISEIMRYSAGQEIHTEIEISNFNILGDNLRDCLVSYILRVIFRLGI